MGAPTVSDRILWVENVGFLALILLSWANELFDLPGHLFGGHTRMNWREAAMETFLILLVWLVVHTLTKRLLTRLHYLEGFMMVCAWCRKIGHDHEWMPMEQYFLQRFDVKTSHGICPDCAAKFQAETEARHRKTEAG